MAKVKEEQLVKALSQMEAIAKGDPKGKLPKTTDAANGGFSTEGDAGEMGVGGEPNLSDMGKATKGGKKKTLADWAKENSEETSSEEVSKAMNNEDESEDESEEEESSEEMSEDEEEMSKASKKKSKLARKSTIANLIKSDAAAGPVVDVSPFIEHLVDQVSDAEHDLRKAIVGMREEQGLYNNAFRKSIVAMGNLILDIKKGLDEIRDLPAATRKSVLSKSEVFERFEEERPDFSKSQVLDAMLQMAQAGKIKPIDVTRYETTNSMDGNVRKSVEDFLRKSA